MLGIIAGIVVKLIGGFGLSALKGVLATIQTKAIEDTAQQGIWATTLGAAIKSEVEMREIASKERIALWGSWTYRFLIYLIVVPPSIYLAAVWADTLFQFKWNVAAAPPRFEAWGLTIVLTFMGVGGAANTILGAISKFRK